jgi:hypothetical protein
VFTGAKVIVPANYTNAQEIFTDIYNGKIPITFFSLGQGEYYYETMVDKSNRFLENEKIKDPNYEVLKQIEKEFKHYSLKTASKEKFNDYVKNLNKMIKIKDKQTIANKRLMQFIYEKESQSSRRDWCFSKHVHKQKCIQQFANNLVDCYVGCGEYYTSQSCAIRGNRRGPIKEMREKMQKMDQIKKMHILDEYNTSRLCHRCSNRLLKFNANTNKAEVNKGYSKLLYCPTCSKASEDGRPCIWNRDKNAAINILKNYISILYNGHLLPEFDNVS